MSRQSVTIAGRTIAVTNLDRVMYPGSGTTKAEVLEYFLAVAEPLGDQVRSRLLTRKRWPHGVSEQSFFEKNLPVSAPDWIPTVSAGRDPVRYPVLTEADLTAAFAWFAQAGVLEFHVPQWRVPVPETAPHADRIVIDLDPGPPAGLPECCEVALAVRAAVEPLGFSAVPVLSGNKGMQLYLPLAAAGPRALLGPDATSRDTSDMALTLATSLEEAMPKLVVSKMAKALRPGRVLIDWSQNNAAKTTIAPYSLRGTHSAQVAAPVTWDEVAGGGLAQLGPGAVVERLAEMGDPFA